LLRSFSVLFRLLLWLSTKWLGNIIAWHLPDNWDKYWNQASSEDGCIWNSVQAPTIGASSFNWGDCDRAYNHCQTKRIPFTYDAFLGGSQEPRFLVDSKDQKGAFLKFMTARAARYQPQFINVVNEPVHALPLVRDALGGDSTTGWVRDRQRLGRRAALPPNHRQHWHSVPPVEREQPPAATLTANVNSLGATRVPVYSTELDINGATEGEQLTIYQRIFPAFWLNPNNKGIIMWGYIIGETWKDDTGIVDRDTSELGAMKWLKDLLDHHKV
jgi:endo-1,4-beta-xylanase